MKQQRGFTLIELLTALLILSLLALLSFRGLSAVLDAREHVATESEKWRHISAFFSRFEQDVHLAAPRPVRTVQGVAPAWLGRLSNDNSEPMLEFSRFATAEGIDKPRRIAYTLNNKQEIELWLWAGLDTAPDAPPVHYPILKNVTLFEFQYLNSELLWVNTWPVSLRDAPIPLAVRLRIIFTSSEEIVRVFSLRS